MIGTSFENRFKMSATRLTNSGCAGGDRVRRFIDLARSSVSLPGEDEADGDSGVDSLEDAD